MTDDLGVTRRLEFCDRCARATPHRDRLPLIDDPDRMVCMACVTAMVRSIDVDDKGGRP